MERQGGVVLEDLLAGDLAADDAAKMLVAS